MTQPDRDPRSPSPRRPVPAGGDWGTAPLRLPLRRALRAQGRRTQL